MLTKMRNNMQTAWRQVLAWTTEPPLLGAAEQTRLSWARPIRSYDDVPPVYRSFFAPLEAEGCAFPYTIRTPTFEGFVHRTTEKLVCDLGHEICILEKRGNTFEAQSYPLDGISHVQVRSILLDSRITISGMTRQEIPASCTLKFNSVTDYLFTPILNKIRRAPLDSQAVASSESAKFDPWIGVSFKFMNYAKCSLLAGEKVVHAILQPEIRAPALTVLGKTYYRRISPMHASILTDRELILIREDEKLNSAGKYGGIWNYIPLTKILTLSLSEKDGDLALSIQLPARIRLECLFRVSARRQVDQLVERFGELIQSLPKNERAWL